MRTLSIAALLGILILACGPKEDPLGTNTLDGTYAAACTAGYLEKYTFSGSNYTRTVKNHSDTSCNTLTSTRIESGTYSLGDSVTEPEGAKALNFTRSSVTITPANASVASSYISDSYCGLTSWNAEQATDVTGRTCGSATMPSNGSVDYNIYVNELTNIRFGDESGANDGTTEAKRPTSKGALAYFKE